jgi:hypothetical protein
VLRGKGVSGEHGAHSSDKCYREEPPYDGDKFGDKGLPDLVICRKVVVRGGLDTGRRTNLHRRQEHLRGVRHIGQRQGEGHCVERSGVHGQ